MVKYCELFYSFLKIGTFTVGGGYAMIPLMEEELVDKRQWMSREEFLDQLALSQSMPGVLAVNMATGLGYRLRGMWGAVSPHKKTKKTCYYSTSPMVGKPPS